MLSRFSEKVIDDFVIIDSIFPQKEPLSFRNTEINEYLTRIKNSKTYAMYPMQPGPEAWFSHGYGISRHEFDENKAGYLAQYPQNDKKICYLDSSKKYKFKLAYSFFLAETYVLLPFYEKNRVPFVFVLYPGGSFGLNNKKSDQMLKAIFGSKYFKGVIVTQEITRDYIVKKNLCPYENIHYIYGGFVQFKKNDLRPKKYYRKNKRTFDICFVAAKYSEKGKDKGYDLFIETASRLCKTTDDIMFHVIGGFDKDDIDISEIKTRIKFYGYKNANFLRDFYSHMDIFLAPSRPNGLYRGNFDGFPLGIDAGYCGVALFVADELAMNQYYKDSQEIVIVPLDSSKIADLILQSYNNTTDLYKLSRRGQIITNKLFDMNYQVDRRIDFFKKFVSLKIIKNPRQEQW